LIQMDANKIAKSLSAEELQEFLDRCWKTPGLTLAKVQELAGEYGIEVSLMGARSFKSTTFASTSPASAKPPSCASRCARRPAPAIPPPTPPR
jgi:hypothetical protein